jgi:hypothetical protein
VSIFACKADANVLLIPCRPDLYRQDGWPRGKRCYGHLGTQYAVFIIFTGVIWIFIDKTGRRTLLVYGALGIGLCHFIVGGVIGRYYRSVPEGIGGNASIIITVDGNYPANMVSSFRSYLLSSTPLR